MTDEIAEIRERRAGVSDGPWSIDGRRIVVRRANRATDGTIAEVYGSNGNRDFFAHAPTDIDTLLSALTSAHREIASPEDGGRAIIEGGHIVIRVAINGLPVLVDVATNGNFKVTDAATFAKELASALNDEEEDGTTRIHLAFDAAIEFAIEQGAEGIEEAAHG